MKRLVLAVAALAALSSGATAQFAQFTWSIYNPAGFITSINNEQILLGSTGQSDGDLVYYFTVSPVDAMVSVHGATLAQPKGDCGDSVGLFGAENDVQTFGDCSNATVNFSVHAGEKLLFGLKVLNGGFAGDAYWSQFVYRPYWIALGGALAGGAGTPALAGHGVLEPGEPFGLNLSGAAPGKALGLVIGFGTGNLPFKGGVMVPTPNAILLGLATDAHGGLALHGTWPNPGPGGSLFLQAWIADAGGPQGFAASNALQAVSY